MGNGRSRIRALAGGVALALTVGGAAVAAPPAFAAKPTVTATGSVICAGNWKVKIAPPLTNTPATGPRTITSKFKSTLCPVNSTGNPAITVTSVKTTALTTTSGSLTCASFNGAHMDGSSAALKWKALGGKVTPTNVTAGTWEGEPANLFIPLIDGGTPVISASGSYAGNEVLLTMNSTTSLSAANPACSGKGIKKFGGSGGVLLTPPVS